MVSDCTFYNVWFTIILYYREESDVKCGLTTGKFDLGTKVSLYMI